MPAPHHRPSGFFMALGLPVLLMALMAAPIAAADTSAGSAPEPRYGSGVWEGVKEGDNMVMKKERDVPDMGRVVTSRLTFYEITPESFKWKAEGFATGEPQASWTSECKRRR